MLRHLELPSRTPVPAHTVRAFERIRPELESVPRFVLDSGCGDGYGSAWLAREHPDALIVGIDRSAARLARAHPHARVHLVRAEIAGFWRLLRESRLSPTHHYLLYPNPWPKPGQFGRRWHAHPAFADLLALGGAFELRSNWQIYVEEFGAALGLFGIAASIESTEGEPITRFERKYRASGHTLWRLSARLDGKDAQRMTSRITSSSGSACSASTIGADSAS